MSKGDRPMNCIIRIPSFSPCIKQAFKLHFFACMKNKNFREVVVRCSNLFLSRGKSGHHRTGFLAKARGACVKTSSRLVQQKTNRLLRRVRVKWWGKSPPPQGQPSGHCKPNPMQGEIGNQVVRLMVSGTPHLQSLENSYNWNR